MTWISVKDRLPEMRAVVILYYSPKPASRFFEAQDGYMRTGCYSEGRWCDFWEEEEEIDSPTHWQPLPEAPGSEEEIRLSFRNQVQDVIVEYKWALQESKHQYAEC